MHGRGRSEQGTAISVTSEFQAGLGNVSPDMAQLNLFSQVYRRREKGKVSWISLLIWEMMLGGKNVSFNYVSAGNQHLLFICSPCRKESLHRSR